MLLQVIVLRLNCEASQSTVTDAVLGLPSSKWEAMTSVANNILVRSEKALCATDSRIANSSAGISALQTSISYVQEHVKRSTALLHESRKLLNSLTPVQPSGPKSDPGTEVMQLSTSIDPQSNNQDLPHVHLPLSVHDPDPRAAMAALRAKTTRKMPPRFFFHVREEKAWLEDQEGAALADLSAARRTGVTALCEIIMAKVNNGNQDNRASIEITDEHGARLLTLEGEFTIVATKA